MAGAQEDMVAGPDAMVMRLGWMRVSVVVTVAMMVVMVVMVMAMMVIVAVECVVVCHGWVLARRAAKAIAADQPGDLRFLTAAVMSLGSHRHRSPGG